MQLKLKDIVLDALSPENNNMASIFTKLFIKNELPPSTVFEKVEWKH